MKYAVDMGSVATLYIPSFLRTGSGIEIAHAHFHFFFQNKEIKLKIKKTTRSFSAFGTKMFFLWVKLSEA
jgi:hypothetical protein